MISDRTEPAIVHASLKKVYWRLAAMVVASSVFLAVAISWLEETTGWVHEPLIGLALATLFQQPILAGCWAALGPGTWRRRMLASLAWANSIGLACTIGVLIQAAADEWLELWIMILAFWLITLALLGILRKVFHIQWLPADFRPTVQTRAGQFGLRQLCLLTAVISVLLGLARWMVMSGLFKSLINESLPFFGFMFVTLTLTSLPFLLAMFLPTRRQVIGGILAGFLFAMVVVVGVVPLWHKLLGGMPSDMAWVFGPMIGGSLLWVVVFALIVRGSGYRFRSAAELATPVVEPQARSSAE